ncbi:uncharacterized protein LOC126737840 [Anthonomus grandis grandis]|uniref:uncharacterized protein LOC126737840 n=1 Tax=Anthonomus grandis grandis TaxID=2921223 RepID=UPI0021661564|nr:uncharacterized protein LOC126737840 [Anthonomus grandis grandis]
MSVLGVFCVVFVALFVAQVKGHGYLIVPPNRASLWRIDSGSPINYQDNEFFCGGLYVQYYKNEGKCGICGDDYRDPVPRSNENGGTYGNGLVFNNYTQGSVITVTSLITANHLGNIYFQICKLDYPTQLETDECFQPVRLADGTDKQPIRPLDYLVHTRLRLPRDLVCDRCVMRWHYRTGNSWGLCNDGTQDMGCGNQEIFRSCADIRILPNGGSSNEDSTPDDYDSDSTEEDSTDSEEGHHPPEIDRHTPCIPNPHYVPKEQMHKEWSKSEEISDSSRALDLNKNIPCIPNPHYKPHKKP